jgi:REP element-mobilizing transposase RayT
MDDGLFKINRKSHIELGEIYFWTATIHKWIHLLKPDEMKDLIIGSLEHLSNAGKIDVFGFVIMPNHIHLIWRLNALNGKEMPHSSLLKFTAHHFRKRLEKTQSLAPFYVDATNKKYEFWQRDSLAVHLYSKKVAFQKLDYLHANPLSERWNLSTRPEDYTYSSASFYEAGKEEFKFLKDIREEF